MQAEEHLSPDAAIIRQTLPRDFVFHYQDRALKTPEPPELPEEPPVEVPQPLKLRIKRRRPAAGSASVQVPSEFVPLPTFEFSRLDTEFAPVLGEGNSDLQDGFLAPTATSRSLKRYGRILDNPKTPLDQVFNVFDAALANGGDWTPNAQIDPIARPSSTFSDSSESDSSSSSDSSPSFGDSCNSPDSDTAEFVFPQPANSIAHLSPALSFHSSQKTMRHIKPHHRVRWTPEMDEHLWQIYTGYLADPTVTPFKMLPGTAPPLGVCHRVARDAKKSWKGPRNSPSPVPEDRQPYLSLDAALAHNTPSTSAIDLNSDKLSRPQLKLPHLNTNDFGRRAMSKWPRSEASTRKRLRELCKRKPTLSPHYQRLMQSRSPSPFDSSSAKADNRSSRFTSPPPIPEEPESSFSTRDMNISLATSTAPSMQPDGPLSQLASGTLKPRPYSTDWSRPSSRAGAAHQKSKSLHLSLGIGLSSHQINSFRKLASPFHDSNPLPTMDENAPSLDLDAPGPAQTMRQPRPLSGSIKRRAVYPLAEEPTGDTLENRRSFLDGLFRNTDMDATRRVRSRGFSVGGVAGYRHSNTPRARHLSEIFTPPATTSQSSHANDITDDMPQIGKLDFEIPGNRDSQMMDGLLSAPYQPEHIQRLGSPFAPDPNRRTSHTFPRTIFPNGLDGHHSPTRGPSHSRNNSQCLMSSTMRRL